MAKWIIFACLIGSINAAICQLQSPYEFLPTDYSNHFTPHHQTINYVNHVTQQSDKVTSIQYGVTNQDRPLMVCYITHPDNHKRLDSIRRKNLEIVGFEEKLSPVDPLAIVWLSFGVHGNEAGASESALNVLYELAKPSTKIDSWLRNTVVILDPSINPDGYSRYTHWVRNIAGKKTHPGLTDREHMEPWPGGRVNHYMFDLNRDWAWQTQLESKQRIKIYNEWMPHIHVDFHEMGYNDHYYFAPAAKPYHPYITDFQRDFQVDIGKNHASYFDKEGWLYFTREVFDLYYPSYGDTYPIFNGAIGMTHEKAGHGMAGRAIEMNNGDTLTLADRILHHTTTALSTIEIASQNKADLIDHFSNYFSSASLKGMYKTYVVKRSPKLSRLTELLDRNRIQYGYADQNTTSFGYDYFADKEVSFEVNKGDLVIQADQPKGILTQIMFEPSAALQDSLTYDITAWAMPFAYGIQSYATRSPLKINATTQKSVSSQNNSGENVYAYVIPWTDVRCAKILSKLLQNNISVRRANSDVMYEHTQIAKGSMVVARGDNTSISDLKNKIVSAVNGLDYQILHSGFSTNGGDLGGSKFTLLTMPKVLLLSGRNTSPNEVGQVWHYFDEVAQYPISIVNVDDFDRVKLSDYNTLILPDGWYRLKDQQLSNISSWVNQGGKLIAIGGALQNLNEKEGWALSKFATDEEKNAAKKDAEAKALAARLSSYEDSERRGISGSIPGAIIQNNVDGSHPLTFGLGETYFSLKTGRQHYKLLKGAWNPIHIPNDYRYLGFIGSSLRPKFEETVSFAVQDKGRGNVIYMIDNPLYRGFWENGTLLFSNAVFLVD